MLRHTYVSYLYEVDPPVKTLKSQNVIIVGLIYGDASQSEENNIPFIKNGEKHFLKRKKKGQRLLPSENMVRMS